MDKWNGSKWITPHKRLAIYLRDNFCCVYCGANLKNSNSQDRTLDHIVPKSKNGTNKSTNLITCCKKCNSSRNNKSIYKFTNKEIIKKIKRHRYRKLNKYINKAKYILEKEKNAKIFN